MLDIVWIIIIIIWLKKKGEYIINKKTKNKKIFFGKNIRNNLRNNIYKKIFKS